MRSRVINGLTNELRGFRWVNSQCAWGEKEHIVAKRLGLKAKELDKPQKKITGKKSTEDSLIF
jgi:hypothetical protein